MVSFFNFILFCSTFVSCDAVKGYHLTTITLPKTQAQDNEVHNWGKVEFNYTISGTSAQSNQTNSNNNTNQQSSNQAQYNRQQNNQSANSGQAQFQEQRHSEYKKEQHKPMHVDSGRSDFYNQTQSNYDNRYTNNINESGQNNQNNQYTSNAQSNNNTDVKYDWTIKGYNATQWGTPPKESKSTEVVKIQKLTPIDIEKNRE